MADSATFTYQDRLILSPDQAAALDTYGRLFGLVERKLFAAYAAGARMSDLKSAYLKTFGLTARQFNALTIGLKGNVAAIAERRAGLIQETKTRIATVKKVIARWEKMKPGSNELHQKRRSLPKLETKLKRLETDRESGRVRLCFGSQRLFRAQFDLAANGYESHADWLGDWQAARADEIFVIGSKDETAGCQGCVAGVQADGTLTLRLRLPNALAAHGRHLTLASVFLVHGHDAVLASLAAGRAISYRFRRDDKGWRVFATTDMTAPRPASVQGNGAIGVDMNSDHLAVAETDRFGNLVKHKRIACHTYRRTTERAKAGIGDAVKEIALWAEASGKPIVIETLDFARKKAAMEDHPGGPRMGVKAKRRRNRRLSGFAYAKIESGLRSAAFRRGVEVIAVNPAYTSVIGAVNYARRRGISVHCAAALAIARRGLGLAERPAVRLAVCPLRNGGHVAFALPARNRAKHVWSFWSDVRRALSGAIEAQVRCGDHIRSPPPLPPERPASCAIWALHGETQHANRPQHCSGGVVDDVISY